MMHTSKKQRLISFLMAFVISFGLAATPLVIKNAMALTQDEPIFSQTITKQAQDSTSTQKAQPEQSKPTAPQPMPDTSLMDGDVMGIATGIGALVIVFATMICVVTVITRKIKA